LLKRNITMAIVQQFLHTQEQYSITKTPKAVTTFAWTTVADRYIKWQMDLVDVRNMKLVQKDIPIQYLMTVIDTFTKYAFVAPMRTKQAYQVARLLDTLFAHSPTYGAYKPSLLLSDKGSEFENEDVFKICKYHKVFQIFTKSYRPLGIIERFNQTFKRKMRNTKHKAKKDTMRWLNKLLLDYNTTQHSTTQQKPIVVHFADLHDAERLVKQVRKRLQQIREKENKKATWKDKLPLKAGEQVRVLVWLDPRLKASEQQKIKQQFKFKVNRPYWTKQQFTIEQKRGQNYILVGFAHARLKRNEIQKAHYRQT
jgi:transposase InsO family protein